jgi:hypothetical protein
MAKTKEEEYNLFVCLNCDDNIEYEFKDFLKHLNEIHKVYPDHTKGSRNLKLHMNKGQFHQSTYEWMIRDVRFLQYLNVKVREYK